MLDQVSTEEDDEEVSDGDEIDDTGNEPGELKSPTELLISDNKDENDQEIEEEKVEPQITIPMIGNENNDDLVDCEGEGSFSSPEKAHSLEEEQKEVVGHHPTEGGLYRRTVSDE